MSSSSVQSLFSSMLFACFLFVACLRCFVLFCFAFAIAAADMCNALRFALSGCERSMHIMHITCANRA